MKSNGPSEKPFLETPLMGSGESFLPFGAGPAPVSPVQDDVSGVPTGLPNFEEMPCAPCCLVEERVSLEAHRVALAQLEALQQRLDALNEPALPDPRPRLIVGFLFGLAAGAMLL